MIIGICGGSCSGKTTLANKLFERLKDRAVVLCQDRYYLPRRNMSEDMRKSVNFDCPDALDNALFIKNLSELKEKKGTHCPIYDYTVHDRCDETLFVEPKEFIIAEGILLFQNEEIRNLIDLKIFAETDADERLARRIIRDSTERGRDVFDIIRQYRSTVKPMHDIHISPYKKYADIILETEEDYENAVDEIIKKLPM